jgi:hypothetical protein
MVTAEQVGVSRAECLERPLRRPGWRWRVKFAALCTTSSRTQMVNVHTQPPTKQECVLCAAVTTRRSSVT